MCTYLPCGLQPFSICMVVVMQNIQRKVNLQEMKVNVMKQGRFVLTEMNFVLEKNGGHKPRGLWVV